jgi:uncharacterized membrane protein
MERESFLAHLYPHQTSEVVSLNWAKHKNRQAGKDRIKANLDYQVNLKSELEIGLILKELTELQNRLELVQQDQTRMHRSLTQITGNGPRNSI